jgi:hypothetical protein
VWVYDVSCEAGDEVREEAGEGRIRATFHFRYSFNCGYALACKTCQAWVAALYEVTHAQIACSLLLPRTLWHSTNRGENKTEGYKTEVGYSVCFELAGSLVISRQTA